MKRVMKQPAFWVTFFCLVFAVCTAVGSSLMNPGIAVLDKFEKGMNKGKFNIVMSCFTPETQAIIKTAGKLGEYTGEDVGGDLEEAFEEALSDVMDIGKLNILYGKIVEDEEGAYSVQTFSIYNQDGQCTEADYEEIDLEEADGKIYLSTY